MTSTIRPVDQVTADIAATLRKKDTAQRLAQLHLLKHEINHAIEAQLQADVDALRAELLPNGDPVWSWYKIGDLCGMAHNTALTRWKKRKR